MFSGRQDLPSDASAISLSSFVLESLKLRSKDRETVCFEPAGSSKVTQRSLGPRIFVLSLFDGVGALMVALSRLECTVVGYASCEIDKHCKRLTRTRWPGVVELGDIRKVTDKTMEVLSQIV